VKILFRPEGGDPGSTPPGTPPGDGKPAGDPPAGDPPPAGDTGWKAPENKEALDKIVSDAVSAAKPKPPENYDLKLPEKTSLDAKITERTAATARTLGLSNEAAQKTLDFIAQEAATAAEARVAAASAEWSAPSEQNPEGGTKWREQEEKWRADSLADKDLGGGKPELLQANVGLVNRVLATYFDKESIDFFTKSGLGSHPALLRGFLKIAKAAGESTLVRPEGEKPGEGKRPADRIYDGAAAKQQPATAAA
jgi:hypothetical protein